MTSRLRALTVALVFTAACAPSDSTLRAMAHSRLAVDAATSSAAIDVSVIDGTARLSGSVRSREQQRRASDMVRAIAGIRGVVDETRLADDVIGTHVEEALRAHPTVGGIAITVDVADGIVYLTSSETGPEERRLAVALASRIDGVLRVVDSMK